jgi:hypothetical protein
MPTSAVNVRQRREDAKPKTGRFGPNLAPIGEAAIPRSLKIGGVSLIEIAERDFLKNKGTSA